MFEHGSSGRGEAPLAGELHKQTAENALARVRAIGDTVGLLLDTAERTDVDPAQAALELAGRRLSTAARRAYHQPGGPT